jgi:hypothetical protein
MNSSLKSHIRCPIVIPFLCSSGTPWLHGPPCLQGDLEFAESRDISCLAYAHHPRIFVDLLINSYFCSLCDSVFGRVRATSEIVLFLEGTFSASRRLCCAPLGQILPLPNIDMLWFLAPQVSSACFWTSYEVVRTACMFLSDFLCSALCWWGSDVFMYQ